MNKLTPLVIAGFFSTGTVMAQDKVDFDRHDADGNGYLNESEWRDVRATSVDFSQVDSDGNGKLTKTEVKTAAKSQDKNKGGSAMLTGQKSFQDYDKNSDGQISQDEAMEDAELASHFAVLDANGDQALDRNELQGKVHKNSSTRRASAQGPGPSSGASYQQSSQAGSQGSVQSGSQQSSNRGPEMSDAAFEEIDADSDDRITRQEARQANNEYVTRTFDGIDENGDGAISKDEIKADR